MNTKIDNQTPAIKGNSSSSLKVNQKTSAAKDNVTNEFENNFQAVLQNQESDSGLHFSNHAVKRLEERNIDLDTDEIVKLRNAVNKLRGKGGKNSLIISQKGAYIVDVDKSTVVTALDKNNMGDNVFTKIDSTLILN